MTEKQRLLNKIKETYTKTLPFPDRAHPEIVQRALLFIGIHLFENGLNIEQVKSECRISDNNFSGKFKYFVGSTPKQYILHHRISLAQILLKTTEFTITETAYEVGFSETASFSNTFKKYTGLSPGKYRAHIHRKIAT